MDRRWWFAVWLFPGLALSPLLITKVPVTIHGPREIAGFFQSLAFVRAGIDSYSFLTPEESFSALHLHSFLSSPLIGLGYTEGGRLVSLLAAIAAVIIVAWITAELTNRRTALLASALLWAQPMFVRHAWVFQPTTLSIALTAGTIFCIIRFVRSDDPNWFGGAVLLLVLGITNHMWEATVALPVFAVLLWDRRWKPAAGIVAIAPLTAGLVIWITNLQPEGPSTLFSHGTQNIGSSIFFSPDFWLAHLTFYHGFPAPYGLALTIILPVSVVFCMYWGYRVITEGHLMAVVLASWLASGLAIPLLLARGYTIHYYYLWALFAPFSITVAIYGRHLIERMSTDWGISRDVVLRTVLAVLVIGSMGYSLVFQYGALSNSGLPVVEHIEGEAYDSPEATEAGIALRTLDPNPDKVLFVGDWEPDFNQEAGRVAVYSDILFQQRRITDPGGPELADSLHTEIPCDDPQSSGKVVVLKSSDGIIVHDCREESDD